MALRKANEVKILRPYKKRNFVIRTVRMFAIAMDWTIFLGVKEIEKYVSYKILMGKPLGEKTS
jgi:hypothetical protein